MPKNEYINEKISGCEDLKEGTIINVVAPWGQGDCDTTPLRGVCAFDNPMSIGSPQIWDKYGK